MCTIFRSSPLCTLVACQYCWTRKLVRTAVLVLRLILRGICLAGQDATDAFFSLHRYEVLQRSQFARLRIGAIQGEKQQVWPRPVGALSKVPYAEPTWLTEGYHSPYYKEVRGSFMSGQHNFTLEFRSTITLSRRPSVNSWTRHCTQMRKPFKRRARSQANTCLTNSRK